MLRFLKIFQNLGVTILFIFLEIISLFLIVRFNKNQNEIFLHSSNEVVSNFIRQQSKLKQSLDLKNQNDDLLSQNAKLIEELVNEKIKTARDSSEVEKKYRVLPATIINSSIHTLNNYITIDKGKKDSLQKSMGIIGEKGPIGVINQVTENYATAVSLLNVNLRISASVEEKNHAGYLSWSGGKYDNFKLYGIPKHATIGIGDIVSTSGHSSIFPKGIRIGTITSYEIIEGGAFYDINVSTLQDLTKSDLVYVIKNRHFEEIKALERLNEN